MDQRLLDVATDLKLKQTMFFNLKFSAETQSEKSKTNPEEAQFIQNLLLVLSSYCKSGNLAQLRGKIGIISPYKEQVHLIRRKISQVSHKLKMGTSSEESEGIEVNTVDAY